jgi:hypothetical protein
MSALTAYSKQMRQISQKYVTVLISPGGQAGGRFVAPAIAERNYSMRIRKIWRIFRFMMSILYDAGSL